jgi:hypothetical protein
MSHPCVPHHACDHCYICETLHICCATIPPEQRAQLEADTKQGQAERFREAVVAEARRVVTLADLIQAEAAQGVPALPPGTASLALPPAPAAEAIPHNSRKEPVYVIAARKA